MILVVKAFDGRLLERAVHAFDLAVRPGMLDLREPVFDAIFVADTVEEVDEGITIPLLVGELNAVIRQ